MVFISEAGVFLKDLPLLVQNMEKIVGVVSAPSKFRIKKDDDWIDRVSSRYTVMILAAFAVGISLTSWVRNPITCWAPKHFTGSHTKYATSYCWVKNTYYLPFSEYIPKEHEEDLRHTIGYYQWIPWILVIQAFFFYLPSAFWHGLNDKAGVDSDDILELANGFRKTAQGEMKEKKLHLMTSQLDRFLGARTEEMKAWKQHCHKCMSCLTCKCCGTCRKTYLVVVYLISKILYLANVVAQLFILNSVFKVDYNIFPYQFFKLYADDTPLEYVEVPTFPRVTMCDFKVRYLGVVQRYTLQCVLPLNLFVEIMYLFLWFWMVVLAILTGLSLLVWFLRFVIRHDRLEFIKRHLESKALLTTAEDRRLCEVFLDSYLQQDGTFILRLIAHNTNSITTTEVICHVWQEWKETRAAKPNGSMEPHEKDKVTIDREDADSRNSIEKPPLD